MKKHKNGEVLQSFWVGDEFKKIFSLSIVNRGHYSINI